MAGPLVVGLLVLSGCSSDGPDAPVTAGGRSQGFYKVGSPYQVNGVWYYPHEDFAYDATGEASWYGPGFHGRLTANGEIFDQNAMTAAHTTLQLPSLVRVTNLENGRSAVLRVNDRGPFRYNRVIDVSRHAAEVLGFLDQGTAEVRVQVLPEESRQLAEAAKRGDLSPLPPDTVLAAAPPAEAAPATDSVVSAGPAPAITPPAPDGGLVIPATMPPALAAPALAVPAPAVPERPLPVSAANAAADPIAVLAVSAVADQTLPAAAPPPGTGQIYVQAGAYVDYDNAVLLRDRLSRFGATQITTSVVDGVAFHRVRLGPLSSMPDADRVLGSVQNAGQPAARIVVEN